MKILVFEWMNSGGLWLDGVEPSDGCPIQYQGAQMLSSVAVDFAAGGAKVVAMVDDRIPHVVEERGGLARHEIGAGDDVSTRLLSLAQGADWVLVIAPETGSTLSRCLSWLTTAEHKLLNPSAEFAALTSNKSQLFEFLDSKGFTRFPSGLNFQNFLEQVDQKPCFEWTQDFGLPAVLKPVDGAGSAEVNLINSWAEFKPTLSRSVDQYRLEAFVPGAAVSVSVLCGGDRYDVLAPTIQMFEGSDTKGEMSLGDHYVGAKYPIPPEVARRSVQLAVDVLKCLPKIRGYIGMDLMIADPGSSADDRLLEINPRLTMSYSRLSEIYGRATWSDGCSESHLPRRNLAMRMVEQADKPATDAPVICTFREPCP